MGHKDSTSNATYAHSNGQAETCVQILKGVFKKPDKDSREHYLVLLEYRNTPVSGLQYPYHFDEQITPIKTADKADIAAIECGRCTRWPKVSTLGTANTQRKYVKF